MKAVGFRKPLPITDPSSLLDLELPDPKPLGHDLLVQVKAVSVNPMDTKMRAGVMPGVTIGDATIMGWDAAGVVLATGPDATQFKAGDAVWYSGSNQRPGTNSELHLVDERLVGRKPASLGFAEAAAMPLTTITAWELLFDRMGVVRGKPATGDALLIIGAAGGVGSILTQLACRLTGMTVIGTASRKETADWVRTLGAHHVIDHTQPLPAELKRIGIPQVSHVAGLTQSDAHFKEIVELIAPQGRFGLIDALPTANIMQLKWKSVSIHWEMMFTRSQFGTPDMLAQSRLLTEVAHLIDAGVIRSTVGENFGPVTAANLKRAHALIESGKARGKIVLEGF
jgi:zinc-binding alcohol dehydrogenase family protein